VTLHSANFQFKGEMKELTIRRPHVSAGLPSFFQRHIRSFASAFSSTPTRKPSVAEFKSDQTLVVTLESDQNLKMAVEPL
jgi:hypothetical protein